MAQDYKGAAELLGRTANFIEDHRNLYISSGGAEGHVIRYDHVNVPWHLPALLLETVGRKSGRRHVVALIYGLQVGEFVVIGSKGGYAEHPAWYLNLREQERVNFQVGTQAWSGTWREPEGAEYDEVWAYMEKLFPNYADYRKAVTRTIPIVMLKPGERIPVFKAD